MKRLLLLAFLIINSNFLVADSEGPVLSNFIVSPSTIDVSEGDVTITFFIDATDETGVTETYRPSIINAATNAGGPAANDWELISGTNQDGTWQATMTIPSTQGASEWYLYSQSFEDIYGYSSALETDSTGGADNGGLTVINSNSESNAPVLSNLTVSPDTVYTLDGDTVITFTIDATDETGVTETYRPSIINAETGAGGPAAENWQLVSGTTQDGTWQATMTIPSTQGTSDWYLYSQSFVDIWTNSAALETDNTGGADNGGLTVLAANSDTSPPVLSNLTVTPDRVNVSTGAKIVTFSIDAADGSGVTTTYRPSIINAETGAGGPAAEDWELVSGTTQSGTWQATMTIPETQGASTWYLYSQSFEDSFTNSAALETDNRGGKRFGGLTVINDDQNSAPKIKSTSFDVDENTTDIGTLDVTDRDGDELTFAITGPKIISVDINTGELTFNNAPNYENRSAYSIKVFVSDGEETSTKRIAINVLDVNESPSLQSSRFTLNQGETRYITLQASDPENDSISFQLGSNGDASYFSLNQSSGVLRFKDKPNFSERTVFDIPVILSDGESSLNTDVTITLNTEYLKKLGSDIYQQYPNDRNYANLGDKFLISPNGRNIYTNIQADSENGTRTYVGQVRGYQFSDGDWEEIDSADGQNESEYFGMDFVMSRNQKKLSGTGCTNSTYCDYGTILESTIKRFEYNSITEQWASVGTDIQQEVPPFKSIGGMNDQGNIILLRQQDIVDSSNNKVNIKFQRFKQKADGEWKKYKKPIKLNEMLYNNASATSSNYFYLDPTGNKVLIFYPRKFNGQWENKFIAYEFEDENWERIGNIVNLSKSSIPNGDGILSPQDIQINRAFTKFSFRADQSIYFFEYNPNKNKWKQKGYTFSKTEIGKYAISDDFKMVAYTTVQSGDPQVHKLHVYKLSNTNKWKRFGSPITFSGYWAEVQGLSSGDIKFSEDGNTLAIACKRCTEDYFPGEQTRVDGWIHVYQLVGSQ